MIAAALRNRPELREEMVKVRINQQDADAALLRIAARGKYLCSLLVLIPMISYFTTTGCRGVRKQVGTQCVCLHTQPKAASIDAQKALNKARALALTMAVMTQVHVARAKFANARHVVAASGEYYRVQRRILS